MFKKIFYYKICHTPAFFKAGSYVLLLRCVIAVRENRSIICEKGYLQNLRVKKYKECCPFFVDKLGL